MLYWKNRHDGYFVLGKEIKNIMIPINNKFSYNFTFIFLPTYTSLSFSSEGSFFFFSLGLARSFSFLFGKHVLSFSFVVLK